jgi:serine/threonine-protein kinase RsbW/stage II sporulation protein AB (anti-sigma F factor)
MRPGLYAVAPFIPSSDQAQTVLKPESSTLGTMEASMLELRLPADVTSATVARRALTELTGAARLDVDAVAVALCVSEAVPNAVVHGDRERPGRDDAIELRAWEQDGGLCVVVRDFGVGLAARKDSPGMGLGMPLMTAMADRFTFAPDAPGTRVEMWFGPSGRGV